MLEKLTDFLVGLVKGHSDLVLGPLSQLIEMIFNVLTEFVIGPCETNQQLMINNRKVIDVINIILRVKLSDQIDRDRRVSSIKILHQTTIFLESLVTGNKSLRSLSLLVENLDRKNLAN